MGVDVARGRGHRVSDYGHRDPYDVKIDVLMKGEKRENTNHHRHRYGGVRLASADKCIYRELALRK